jgi:hypothetical protein
MRNDRAGDDLGTHVFRQRQQIFVPGQTARRVHDSQSSSVPTDKKKGLARVKIVHEGLDTKLEGSMDADLCPKN